MKPEIQQTLLRLFTQVSENPALSPSLPLDAWPEQSPERQLLAAFQQMLARQQEYQDHLRREHERMTFIIGGANDGFWDCDLLAQTVYLSPRLIELFGIDERNLTGRLHDVFGDWYQLIHLDDGLRALQAFRELREGKSDSMHLECRRILEDGSYRWILVRGAAIRDVEGEPIRVGGTATDITDRKLAEAQLQEKEELLEQRVAERTRELSTLLNVSQAVTSTLELKSLLPIILDQIVTVNQCTGASVMILEGDELEIVEAKSPVPTPMLRKHRFSANSFGPLWKHVVYQEPLIIADVQGTKPEEKIFREAAGPILKTPLSYVRCWMGVPLVSRGQVIGILSITSSEPGYFTPAHASLSVTIANQAAVAIENARLYEQAQEVAVLEERQRLARELHDSVSQALYGISLGAHTACTLLERDPSRLEEPLHYVLALAETALMEMRALIFELRPESLESEGLLGALTKQALMLRARHHLDVQTEFGVEPDAALEIKQTLYRIAQEALNNIARHAQAHSVTLKLACQARELLLSIYDDGIGFDSSATFPGHLGLHSMQERAEKLGGLLVIESAPGRGTSVCARIPLDT